MDKNQNGDRNQQNDGTSKGKTNMDLDKTPGRVEESNDKNKNLESENEESESKNKKVIASDSGRETDNRNNDNRNNDNRDNENEDEENQDEENDHQGSNSREL